ncbi:TonB-dependent receptor [Flavivirga aquimarina]|uniref:TonB-dependent receptor n=1 Tax=Flavivirga aquimarina TaxID=2027862 RepID=A0ABT8WH94_9FLAO|nr:TonB-dependent receptor [Flavivirga aquimarina]MDO5972356.1 TonB-dependent receptor [Flavivirga aquimarina]
MKTKLIIARSLIRKRLLLTIMKTFILLLCTTVFSFNVENSFSQEQITIDTDKLVSVDEVFYIIQDQTKYRFLYPQDLFANAPKVQLKKGTIKISKLLNQSFSGSNVNFELSKDDTIIIKEKSTPSILPPVDNKKAQGFQVSGSILDDNGQALTGANIIEKGTTNGTLTDFDGNFSINVSNGSAILVISYIGFLTQEIAINNQSKLTINLKEDAADLGEIVVIGYGSVRKSDLTGAVSSVSEGEITQVPVSSVSRALQGRVAGVNVNQASGQPGQNVVIRIRGSNSISGGNNPLYVVDGFPLDELGSDLNPEDIKSMEILKDASSTAIYGSRGANGVILITTKRGSNNKIKTSYHGFYGTQSLRKKIDLLDRDSYIEMANTIAAEEGNPPVFNTSDLANIPNNDWQDLVYRNAMMQNHQISLSGGNENVKYYTSLNYLDQEGIIKNSGFDRYSIRVNGDVKITEKLSLRNNLVIAWSEFNQTFDDRADGFGAIPFTTLVMPPTSPILEDDGNYSVFSGVPWGGTNPVGFSENDKYQRLNTRILGNIDLTYQITDGLSFKTSLGINSLNTTTNTYRPIGIISTGPSDGQASKSFSKNLSFINENILNYTKQFNKHSIGALAGITYQKDKSDGLSASASGFLTDVFENNVLQSANTISNPTTSYEDFSLISYLARANYSYNDKYLATFTGRYDGSSKFGNNNKYAFFPSAALAWKISNEDFLSSSENISNLKLRFSIGKSGNQAISSYQTLARLQNTTPIFGDGQNVGFVLSAFENADLKWETTTASNIGIDLGLLNNRINFTADYYVKNTEDLLFNAILPTSSGFTSSVRNVGEMGNKGFEFELATKNFVGDFKWDTSLNMNFNRNKVKSLGNDGLGNPIERIDAPGSGGNWFPLFLGEAGQQLYGFEIEGIYETDAEAVQNGEPSKTAGDYRYRDLDGNGIVNSDDRKILTNLQPDFTFGINNNFSYKNFDLSILVVGSVGNDIVNEFSKYYTALTGNWNVTREAWENRWTGPGSGGTYAKASSNAINTITFSAPNTLWVEDGSYIKFRDIKLGYTLPKNITDKIGIEHIRLYASGQNLITITNYSHYDPEAAWERAPVNGWDRGVYPSTKSVTLGVQVDF